MQEFQGIDKDGVETPRGIIAFLAAFLLKTFFRGFAERRQASAGNARLRSRYSRVIET